MNDETGMDAMFRTLVENSPDVIVRYDLQGRRIYANPAWARLTGHDEAGVLGRTMLELPTVSDPESYHRKLMTAAEGREEEAELAFDSRALGLRHLHVRFLPERDADGRVRGMFVVGRDITERKRNEQAVRDRLRIEQELSRLTEVAPGALFTFRRAAGRAVAMPYASRKLVEVVGCWPEEVAEDAAPLLSLMHPDDVRPFLAAADASADTLLPWHAEFRVNHPVKGEVWIEWQAAPGRDGTDVLWHGYMHEVNARKRLEQELREKSVFQETLLKSLSDVGLQQMVIEDGRIVHVGNRALAREFGFTDAAVDAHPPLETILHPDDRERVLDYHQRRLAGEPVPDTYELSLTTQTGERREYEVAVAVVPGSHPPRVITIGKDISERKRNERELLLLRRAVDQASDALFVQDESQRFIFVNEAATRSLGYSQEELTNMTTPDIDPDFTREMVAHAFVTAELGKPTSFESRHRARDGRIFPVEVTGTFFESDGARYVITTARDITERKRAEQTLQQREREFRSLAENLPVAVIRYDPEQRRRYLNPAAERMLHGTAAELLGHVPGGPTVPALPAMIDHYRGRMAEALATGAARELDFVLDALPADRQEHYEVRFVPEYDADGQPIGVLAIWYDITERKRMETILAQREQEFRSLAESTPDSIIRYDRDQRILYLNDSLVRILGLGGADEVIGRRPNEVWPDGRFEAIEVASRRAMDSAEAQEIEMHWEPEPGQQRTGQIIVVPERDGVGSIIGTLAIGRDITDIRNAERRLKHFFDNLPGLAYTFRLGPDGSMGFPYVSPGVEAYYGVTPEQAMTDVFAIHGAAHPDDRPRIEAAIAESASTLAPFRIESRVCRPGLPERWLDVRSSPVPEADGGILWYGIMLDITDRKLAEEKMRRSEQLLRTLVDATPDWIFIKDREHRYQMVNQGYANALRLAPQDFIGKNDLDLGFPEALVKGNPEQGIRGFWADDRLVLDSNAIQIFPEDPATIDGVVHTFHTIKVPLRDADGTPQAVLAFARDITERKRMEEQIDRERATLRAFFDALPALAWMKDAEGRYLACNPLHERCFGVPEAEILGKTDFDFVDAELAASFRSKDKEAVIAGRPCTNEEWVVFADNDQPRLLETVKAPVRDSANDIVGVIGIAHDITDRKQSEQRLAEAHAFTERLLNAVPDPIFVKDREHRWLMLNDAFCALLGHAREELIGKSDYDFLPAEQADVFWEKDEFVFAAREENVNEECITDGQGDLRRIQTKKVVVESAGQEILIGAIRDITSLRDALEALREKENRLAEAQRIGRMGSWELDLRSGRLEWSDEIHRIFEIDKERFGADYEAFLNAIHPDDRAAVDRAYTESLKNRQPYAIDHRLLFADGRVKHVRETCETSYDEQGTPLLSRGTVQDITEIKETQLMLERSQAELRRLAAHRGTVLEDERRLVAREMHEELAQVLAALRMKVSQLRGAMRVGGPAAEPLIGDMLAMTEDAIRRIRQMVAAMRPTTLEIGIVPTLEWLVEDFTKGTAIACHLQTPQEEPDLTDAQVTSLFRLVQEALTNVALHAEARRVDITLADDGDHYRLSIEDDGKGMVAEDLHKPGLGIVSMREQVGMLGGSFLIAPREGGGVVVLIRFPADRRSDHDGS